jgi:hypothetical protein
MLASYLHLRIVPNRNLHPIKKSICNLKETNS